MFNVVLIGMPGSGKTAVGRLLAQRLAAKFIDTDALIESRIEISIAEFFAEFGEAEFRKLEKEVIASLHDMTNAVIATGGGSIMDPANMQVLSALGTTVALTANLKTLQKRLRSDRTVRPLLFEEGALEELFEQRHAQYDKAEVKVKTDGKTVEEVVTTILGMLKS